MTAMAALVVGAKRIQQIEDALAALDVTIPDDVMKDLDDAFPSPWKQSDPIRG